MLRSRSLVLAAVLVPGAVAVAATPENGTVSAAAPTLSWTGELTGSNFPRVIIDSTGDDSFPCESPYCDTFTLTVADSAELTLSSAMETESDTALSTVRVKDPGGTTTTYTGNSNTKKPFKVKIKNAAKGEYVIDTTTNLTPSSAYTGGASLAVAGGAPAPSGSPAPAPAPGPSPAPSSQPAPKEPFTITVTAPKKLSAKKLARTKKITFKVTVSRPIARLAASLKLGSKVVGTGSRGATSGTVSFPVKLKGKPKKGSYVLTIAGDDGNGVQASRDVRFKIAK